MPTMYEISEQFRALSAMDGTDEETAQAIADTWESVELAFEDKAENYAKIIAQEKAEADSIAAEIKRLTERKKAREGKADRMKATLHAAMQAAGRTKFSTPLFTFAMQKNPPALVVDDENAIPEQYKTIVTKTEIDKAAIKEACKTGTVEGAHLEQGESLRIK